eukprot:Skav224927  [mRNA]  locus=scaffold2105:54165:58764:+ [translate_table: standard]
MRKAIQGPSHLTSGQSSQDLGDQEPENSPEGWETHRLGPLQSDHKSEASKSEATDESDDEEHLYNTDHESDFGDLDAVNGHFLRLRGYKTRPLSQQVEKLVTDFQEKQKLFNRRRRDLAQSVSRGIRKEFLQQQERIVSRSKQMAKKLQSGRSRAWRHKWVFALVEADFALTAFWLGASPQTFHLYYTAQMAVVMCCKVFDYRFTNQHYFLLDFCFFANACTFAWLWICPNSSYLFNAVESFCGVLALSIPLFRNSCVPHDFARISNAYVHYPQVLLVLSTLWSCQKDDGNAGDARCVGIAAAMAEPWSIRFFQAWSMYMTWAVLYASVIFGLARKRIERKRRDTLYGYFAHTLGFKDKLPGWLRQYSGLVFMMGHQTLFVSGVGFIVLPFSLQVVVTLLALTIFFHNGGRFYVDHFWKAHERNTVLYLDAANTMMIKASKEGSHSSLESKGGTDDSPPRYDDFKLRFTWTLRDTPAERFREIQGDGPLRYSMGGGLEYLAVHVFRSDAFEDGFQSFSRPCIVLAVRKEKMVRG